MKIARAHSIPTLLSALILAAFTALTSAARAGEPIKQPASTAAAGKPQPKALNPQPEVPSKEGMSDGSGSPKALNPQPEVPSKQKKKKEARDTKKLPGKN